MKRFLNTLFVMTQKSYLRKEGDTVVVRVGGEVKLRVPLLTLQGIVCFGSLTKGGCGGVCPRGGLPCWGCRGPASGVVKKIREGETYNEIMLKILRQRSQMEEERLMPIIRFFSSQANNALNFPHILRNDVARIK